MEAVKNPESASFQQLREGVDGKKLPQAETAEQRARRLKGDREADAKAAKNKRNKAAEGAGGKEADAAAGGRGGGGRGRGGGGRGRGGWQGWWWS